jgi:hypothetical protein
VDVQRSGPCLTQPLPVNWLSPRRRAVHGAQSRHGAEGPCEVMDQRDTGWPARHGAALAPARRGCAQRPQLRSQRSHTGHPLRT